MSNLPRGQILLETVKAPITRQAVSVLLRSNVSVAAAPCPVISIVVVAYRETDSLMALIETLASSKLSNGAHFQIIVVDNGLRPDVVAHITPLVHRYIKCNDNVGCTQGRNVGAAFCDAALTAFIDADAAIDGSYVEACVQSMDNEHLAAVRGRVVPRQPGGQLPTHYDLGPITGQAAISAEGASVWRTKLFCDAGGFEASLYGREGPVLCYRMCLLFGVVPSAFAYAPSIVLNHDYFESPEHLQRKLERNARIIDQVDRAYPMIRTFLQQFPSFGAKRRADLRVQLKSRLAALKLRWSIANPHMDAADNIATETCNVVIATTSHSSTARNCIELQTVRVDRSHATWTLHINDNDWLHPTLLERVSNLMRQYPTIDAFAIPRRASTIRTKAFAQSDLAHRARYALAVRNSTVPTDQVASSAMIVPTPPLLLASYIPVEAAAFRVARAAAEKLPGRR
jgi:glycosyltransferase involved in cell wall biosynthesis